MKSFIFTFFVCYSVCLTIALFTLSCTPAQGIVYSTIVSLVVASTLDLYKEETR